MTKSWIAIAAIVFAAGCSHEKPTAESTPEKKESGLVEIGLEAQKHFGVKVEASRVQDLKEFLQAPGTVQPTNSRVSTVRPLARGRIHDVLVRVGDRVRQGQPLATYDNIEAGELTAQLAGAKSDLERLRVQQRRLARQTDRARDLAAIGAIPKKELEQASAEQQAAEQEIQSQESVLSGIRARLQRFGVASGDPLATPLATITSPLAGVVTKQDAAPGEVVDASSTLFTITDLSTVWVQAEVYEKDLGRIRLGQPAYISVDTYPGTRFAGKVAYVSDFLEPQTRTARVRCEVPNGDMRLKLDMYAVVNLPTNFSRRTLAVAAGAIQEVGDKQVVFVRKSETQFEPRWITTGNRVGDVVEISHGLKEGEPVVTAAAFHLKSILVGKDLGEE